MKFLFEPEKLHILAQQAVGMTAADGAHFIIAELARQYPRFIEPKPVWLFNNAGGAMGTMAVIHGSIREYVLVFGTPIGTEGHSGRYPWAEIYDYVYAGEMWTYTEGQFERDVYQPGSAAHLRRGVARGYRVADHAWMLEYGRGFIPALLPFGLADSLLSALDYKTVRRLLAVYARLVTRSLLRGKI